MEPTKKDKIFRRIFHMSAPVYLIYYLVPESLLNIRREYLLLAVLFFILSIEFIRLWKGAVLFGLREYEGKQLSAFAWAAIGMTVAFLFFPFIMVVPCLVGMAVVDPLIGETRKLFQRKQRKIDKVLYPFLPAGVYLGLMSISLFYISDLSVWKILLLSTIGTSAALCAEHPKIKWIDDDFLMLVAPLVILRICLYLIQN